MQAQMLAIPDVICFTPRVFGGNRGFFYANFNKRMFEQALGQGVPHFVQDNHSRSAKGVLRGLHYQIQQPQGKLVRVTQGEVFGLPHFQWTHNHTNQLSWPPRTVRG